MNRLRCLVAVTLLVLLIGFTCRAQAPSPPLITNINVLGSQKNLRFKPYPAASSYTMLSDTNPAPVWIADTNFFQAPYVAKVYPATLGGYSTNFGYEWRSTNGSARRGFYRVQVTPLNSNALLAATVLNRLTYGQTPDELQRIQAIGP